MGDIDMCGHKGHGFLAVLVINWVSPIPRPFWSLLIGYSFCTLVLIRSQASQTHDSSKRLIMVRTEWSPIRSVIIGVIDKIGRPRSGSPIC